MRAMAEEKRPWVFPPQTVRRNRLLYVNINNLITTEKIDDLLVMRIEVEQIKDAIVAQDLKMVLTQTVKTSTATKFVLDMGNLTFMTSLGCVAFIAVKHAARDKPARLVLCNITPFIKTIFTAKHLLQQSQLNGNVAFESAATLEAALEMLSPKGSEV